MDDIKLMLQGFVIGIGKIIPGVSGAMFAMMFGVYEKALNIISHLKTEFVKNLKFITLLTISILFAIVFGSSIISKCMNNYYVPTMLFFVGMMSSGIKPLFKNVKGKKISLKNLLFALIICVILILLDFVNLGAKQEALVKTPLTLFMLFISGFLDAVATIVPGICGTALLMILGYYHIVIDSLSDLLNLSNLANNLYVLIPFLIGMIIGALVVSKIIDYLFKNYKTETYYVIIGFAIMSTILIFFKTFNYKIIPNDLYIGIPLFIIGYFIVYFFEKLDDKKDEKNEIGK